MSAIIDVFGARKEVNLMLLPVVPQLGDYVLVHAGFAIQMVDKDIVESGKSMHETSLALSILDIVVEKCREAGGHTVDYGPAQDRHGCRGHARSAELCFRRCQRFFRGGACGTGHRAGSCLRPLQRLQKRIHGPGCPVCFFVPSVQLEVH